MPIWIRERGSRRDLLRHWIHLRHRAGDERPVVDGPLLKDLEKRLSFPSPPEQADLLLGWLREHGVGETLRLDERTHGPAIGAQNGEAFRMAVRDLLARGLIENRDASRLLDVLVTTPGWRYALPSAARNEAPDPQPINGPKRDVFLCHASEDKAAVVEPLRAALEAAGITSWYDRMEIRLGDNLLAKGQGGMSISRYVVVVLSTSFVGKRWPDTELNAALNMETSSGQVKVLPVLYGSEAERGRILERYPFVAPKLYAVYDDGLDKIVAAIRARLDRD